VNDLIPVTFQNQQFNIIDRAGKPWFVAKDLAKILKITSYKITCAKFPEDEVSEVYIIYLSSNGVKQRRKVIIINLAGVFRFIINSNKPEAKQFKDFFIKKFASGFEIPQNDRLPGPDEMRGGMYYVNGKRVYCYKGKIYQYLAEMHDDIRQDYMLLDPARGYL
jgi:hypothetical protein